MEMRRMRGKLWIAALMLLASCTDGPPRVVEPRTDAAPAPRGAALLRTTMLDGQNAERATLGLPPLSWDPALVTSARAYALEMTRTGRFRHADQPPGPNHEGENLWTGTTRAYTYQEMLGHWLDERRVFVNGVTPAFSTTGDYRDASHYAQIVWRNSQRMGCAMAGNAEDEYLVCRYSPTGNVVGERVY
jgi:uncharacterized protein YkwD